MGNSQELHVFSIPTSARFNNALQHNGMINSEIEMYMRKLGVFQEYL